MINTIGGIAGILTTIAIIPQIIKAIKTKHVKDISPRFFTILIIGLGLWVIYGIFNNDWPIIITNAVSFILNGLMLFLYHFQKNNM